MIPNSSAAFRNFQSAFSISSALRSLPIFRLETTWRFIGEHSTKELEDFRRLVRITDDADNFAAYRRMTDDVKVLDGTGGGRGGGGGGGDDSGEVAFIAPLMFLGFYVNERRRLNQWNLAVISGSGSKNSGIGVSGGTNIIGGCDNKCGDTGNIASGGGGCSVTGGGGVSEDDWATELVADAVLRRVESEALELETREKLRLLCLAETRHDSRWACLMLRGWTKDKIKSMIPCFAVRAAEMEAFVASQRPIAHPRRRKEEEEEEESVRIVGRVAVALDKFVNCNEDRLEARLLKAQCAALGYHKLVSDPRLRAQLLRSPCNPEKDNLLISFLHDPVCELNQFWRNL